MFDHKKIIAEFEKTIKLTNLPLILIPNTKYGVYIAGAVVNPGQTYWRVIGVHHLTPDENRGKHDIFLAVIDENGNRIPNAKVGWTWEGRRANEMANPVVLDKPDNEPPGNLSLGGRQVVTVWIDGQPCDTVRGLRTSHPDEPGPNGERWNTWGHHSFFVCWQRTVKGGPPPTIPPVEQPVIGSITSEQIQMIYAKLDLIEQISGEIREILEVQIDTTVHASRL